MDVREACTIGRSLMLAALIGGAAAFAWAQDAEPLISIDLPSMGPQYRFGDWLEGALRDEEVMVRWPHLDEIGGLEDEPTAVVTWSDPERGPGETKRLRGHVRSGGGLIYVIGEGKRDLQRARTLLGPLDIDVRPLDGGAGAAEWAAHPLTEGSEGLGAVNAGSSISGVGAMPLIRTGGRQIAAAFDWGPMGRAVVLDHSVLFDQLHEAAPRPAVRDFLVRATLWVARGGEEGAAPPQTPDRPEIPTIDELIGQDGASRITFDTAVLDLPDGKKDNWPDLRELLTTELERAGIEMSVPQQRQGDPLLDSGELERAGLVVIGSARGADEVHWSEPLALGWFFNRGGRILAIPHAAGGTLYRMVGFNKLLTQLRIAVSLERDNGRAHLALHPITRGIRIPEDGLRVREGAQVWAPLTDPLVTVRSRPAAIAWQLGNGRIVVIDGELLLAQRGEQKPYPEMVALLRDSIEWLMGEE